MSSQYSWYTVKDTGRKFKVRKVAPDLVRQVHRDFPAPKPPLVPVQYEKGVQMEPNADDAQYLRDLEQWQKDRTERVARLLIRRGVYVEMTPEVKAEIEDMRIFYKEEMGRDLPYNDLEVYVRFICVGTTEDLDELINALSRRTFVQEEDVQKEMDNFRGTLGGNTAGSGEPS